ncbi:hypothetical protein Clacol_000540 [Clathrus columnatus]|uniref:Uncharacterized protein n=1 Tax=Clathrus columnatus TaxID=1419009 RepID=A0AAV4ZZB0_9AGAM|nr:hypothetical protein Clacol_000540 [Clathrus columnatus]
MRRSLLARVARMVNASRKKPPPKKQAEQAVDEGSPSANSDNASPGSSSTTPAARDPSPSRKSPLCNIGPSSSDMSGRRTHSSQQPIHNNNNNSIPPYPSSSQQQPIRQHSYSSISPPSVSPASFHHHNSPTSEYPSYTNSPISNGHGHNHGHGHGHGHHTPSTAGTSLSRHDLPSIQTSQSRLSNISVDPSHNIGTWHTAPMMSSSVDSIEPFKVTLA